MMRFCIWLLENNVPAEIAAPLIGDVIERRYGSFRLFVETLSALWHFGARPHHGDGFVTSFLSDLRIAARLLRRSPAYMIASVLTLGLSIGATTAIFSVIDPVLLRSLPYPKPDHLAFVWERDRDGGRDNVGFQTYRDLVTQSRTIESAAAIGDWQPTLSDHGEPERVSGDRVSWPYFRTLGVRPALGRDFIEEEDAPGHNQVVILSHGLWQRRFAGDSAIVGNTISIDGNPMTVLGVMPASFDNVVSPNVQIWRVLGYSGTQPWACRTCHHLRMIARIRPDVRMDAAARELDGLFASLVKQFPTEYASVGALTLPVQSEMTRQFRPALLALGGAVVLVLLIAVANLMSLALARAVRREDEFAIRTALGARHGRIVRQLLTEGLLLATLGGLVAVVVAFVALPSLVARLPQGLPRVASIRIDLTTLLVTGAVVLTLAILVGLASARRRGDDLGINIRSGARLAGGRHHLTRAALVVGEVALSLMLLVSAGLVARSLVRLLSVNVGFDPSHLVTLEFNATGPNYRDNARVYALHDRARTAVRALPGVTGVGVANQLPLGGNVDSYGVVDPENPPPNPELAPSADRYVVSSDYFATMRIPIVEGHAFTEMEAADTSNKVALVSTALAQRLWPGRSAIGRRIRMGGPEGAQRTIIGVTGNVRHRGLDAIETLQFYVPEGQWMFPDNQEVLVVRTRGDAGAMAATVRRTVAALDPTQPVVKLSTMDQVVAASMAQRRLALVLFAAFATAALLLAIAGFYGVLAGTVAERTKELGVHSALGATPAEIVVLVVGQGGKLAAIGIALGLVGTFGLSRYLRTLLYRIEPNDPVTLVGVALLLVSVTLVACLIPARRASRVDPSTVLRGD